MIEVPLTRGKVALLDDEDAALAEFKWYAERDGRTWYAARSVNRDGSEKNLRLHREVMGVSDPKVQVDHRNGDGLDCRRGNLRTATNAENGRNRRMHSNNTSGFKGVTRAGARWRSRIRVRGEKIHLGYFGTPEAAAAAYDEAARREFGEFARPNSEK